MSNTPLLSKLDLLRMLDSLPNGDWKICPKCGLSHHGVDRKTCNIQHYFKFEWVHNDLLYLDVWYPHEIKPRYLIDVKKEECTCVCFRDTSNCEHIDEIIRRLKAVMHDSIDDIIWTKKN